jgi:hypothetical protein
MRPAYERTLYLDSPADFSQLRYDAVSTMGTSVTTGIIQPFGLAH